MTLRKRRAIRSMQLSYWTGLDGAVSAPAFTAALAWRLVRGKW